jgi:hypothetical protein
MKVHCHVKITEEQDKALKARQAELGVTPSEQIRRAINLYLFADQQVQRDQKVHDVPLPFAPEHQLRLEQAERQQQKA